MIWSDQSVNIGERCNCRWAAVIEGLRAFHSRYSPLAPWLWILHCVLQRTIMFWQKHCIKRWWQQGKRGSPTIMIDSGIEIYLAGDASRYCEIDNHSTMSSCTCVPFTFVWSPPWGVLRTIKKSPMSYIVNLPLLSDPPYKTADLSTPYYTYSDYFYRLHYHRQSFSTHFFLREI